MGVLLCISGFLFCCLAAEESLQPSMQLLVLAGGMAAFYSVLGISTSVMMTYAEGPVAAPSAAMYNAVANVGSAFGPVLLGVIKDRTGSYQGAFLLLGAMVIVSGVMTLLAPNSKPEGGRPRATIV